LDATKRFRYYSQHGRSCNEKNYTDKFRVKGMFTFGNGVKVWLAVLIKIKKIIS